MSIVQVYSCKVTKPFLLASSALYPDHPHVDQHCMRKIGWPGIIINQTVALWLNIKACLWFIN